MTFWGGRSLVDLQLHMTSHGTGIFAMPTGDSRISSINEKYHNLDSTPSKFQLHLRITVNIWSVTQSDNLHLHPLHEKQCPHPTGLHDKPPQLFSNLRYSWNGRLRFINLPVRRVDNCWMIAISQKNLVFTWNIKSDRGSSQNKESIGRASHIPRLFPELPGTSEEFLKLLCSCLKLEKKKLHP